MSNDILNETYRLANGVAIPKLGLGTWLLDDAQAEEAVRTAVELGYRHVDTAQAYGNEAGVGAGLRASGVSRDRVFVTTKVAAELKTYDEAAASVDVSLSRAGLDHFDLVIIHSPQPWGEVNQSDDRHLEGNRETWRALEDAYVAGKARAIGVSNFLQADLENILASCRVRPLVNQVLCHPGATPVALIDWCRARGILVEAYSPVAHGAALGQPALATMAARYGVSVAQLCVRYCLQLGLVALPKTANPEHMAANAEAGFEIAPADMDELRTMGGGVDYGAAGVFPVFGGKL